MYWTDKNLYERITERLTKKKSDYEAFNRARDSIITYFRPDMAIDTNSDKDGRFFGSDIYEATSVIAPQTMASGFRGNMVSKSIDWIHYLMRDFELRGIDELDIFCQDVQDHMVEQYRRSNFYDVQHLFTLDGVTIGSPIMIAEEEILEQRTMWMPQHYKHVYAFYNKYNELNGLMIEDPKWTVKQICDKFIKAKSSEQRENDIKSKFSVALYNAFRQGQFSNEFTIIRAIFRIDDEIWDNAEGFSKPENKNYQYISVYYENGITDKDKQNKPLLIEGYFSKPMVVWDYDKKPWESCSRTPAFEAIYDTLSTQQVFKNFLENMQLKNRPPRVFLKEMRNRLELGPEGLIDVEKDEYNFAPKALDLIGDVQLNKELWDIMQEISKRHFHLDVFTVFTQLAIDRKQPLTATQIVQMLGEKMTLLSPFIETHSRYMQSVDDRMIDIEVQAGRGPFAPDNLENIIDIVMSNSRNPLSSIGLVLELVGPLAKAQKMWQKFEPIRMGASLAGEIGVALGDPDLARCAIKGYETLEDSLKAIGFPMKNFRTEEDYQKIVDSLAQERARQQNFANMIEAAKASKNVSGPVDEKSVLANMAGAA